jgi:glycosyl transferase family 87
VGVTISGRMSAFIGLAVAAIALRVALSYVVAPLTDVYYYDSQAVSALLRGLDPYGYTFTGIPPALVTAGAQSVFAYLPGIFLVLVPLAPFDVRVAMVACELIVAWGIYALGGRWSLLASAVFLLLPFGALFSVVYPNNALPAMALFGLAVLLEGKNRQLPAAILFGLAMASSLLILLAFPFFALLWYRRRGWKELAASLLVAGLVTVPFLAWNPGAFIQDTLYFEFSRSAYPLVSNTPWGVNLNPSVSGIAVTIAGTAVPAIVRGLAVLVLLAFFLRRSGDLRSSLFELSFFLTIVMFVLPGDFFWVYLQFPLQVLLMAVGTGKVKGAKEALNA